MKYKALITGNDKYIIDDFFMDTGDFEVLSTSTRLKDMMGHITCFEPDVFIYCCENGSWDIDSQMPAVKEHLSEWGIPFILIGTQEECDDFERLAPSVADLKVIQPMTMKAIQHEISEYMKKRPMPKGMRKATEGGRWENPVDDPLALFGDTGIKQRKHILVVDDSPIMLKMIKEHLQDEYDIATAVSGKVAMGFLKRRKTDLILLDYDMPEEDGPTVLVKLRENETTRNIPVIFLTGVTDRRKIQEVLLLKPQGYLLKPIDRKKLKEAITQAIG